ncbi:copper transpport protein [Exophiala dermatitidis]|nr:copper transpport protein [Exophiala dermatitidis]KAJ4559979.1 copper transpport protein [Exophiala dermatitidis]KAJ4658362.1 copper transpport protein [Exophiala dermatitidis]
MAAYSTSASSEDTQVNESNSLLVVGRESKAAAERQGTIIKAALYAVQVFYSFFIMLLFMTYNGWVMLAVAVGAFIGYLTFGDNLTSTKSVACH